MQQTIPDVGHDTKWKASHVSGQILGDALDLTQNKDTEKGDRGRSKWEGRMEENEEKKERKLGRTQGWRPVGFFRLVIVFPW